MPTEHIPFSAFLGRAGQQNKEFVESLHAILTGHECSYKIKEAKSGYTLSYLHPATKKTVVNYVFRKRGPFVRIYADHVKQYENLLGAWPPAMKAVINKCLPCKRMLGDVCSDTCRKGFDFTMDGVQQQKCRFHCFLFPLEEETKPYLKEMVEHEMAAYHNNLSI